MDRKTVKVYEVSDDLVEIENSTHERICHPLDATAGAAEGGNNMTFLEKALMDHPEMTERDILESECPAFFQYESDDGDLTCLAMDQNCTACWDLEMPEPYNQPCNDCKPACNQTAKADAGLYWQNICQINARQEAKGKEKYGESLEENTTLTTRQRIEHLQEELIDGLKYAEHLKMIAEDGITANDYQRAALRTANGNKDHWLLNATLGLSGETGEVADIVKKHLYQGHDLDTDHIAEELGDVAWYLALAATAIGKNLGDILQANVDKLIRRYPDGFDKARSIHREGKDEADKN